MVYFELFHQPFLSYVIKSYHSLIFHCYLRLCSIKSSHVQEVENFNLIILMVKVLCHCFVNVDQIYSRASILRLHRCLALSTLFHHCLLHLLGCHEDLQHVAMVYCQLLFIDYLVFLLTDRNLALVQAICIRLHFMALHRKNLTINRFTSPFRSFILD